MCCRYIRYIYNRIILENATVRAAAISALASFGAQCEELRPRVILLLKRALFDNDDEVRHTVTALFGQLLLPFVHETVCIYENNSCCTIMPPCCSKTVLYCVHGIIVLPC